MAKRIDRGLFTVENRFRIGSESRIIQGLGPSSVFRPTFSRGADVRWPTRRTRGGGRSRGRSSGTAGGRRNRSQRSRSGGPGIRGRAGPRTCMLLGRFEGSVEVIDCISLKFNCKHIVQLLEMYVSKICNLHADAFYKIVRHSLS